MDKEKLAETFLIVILFVYLINYVFCLFTTLFIGKRKRKILWSKLTGNYDPDEERIKIMKDKSNISEFDKIYYGK